MAKKSTVENFIKRAKIVHNKKYNYHKVEYINTNTKVIIVCPEHDEFRQTPHSHLTGVGCPKCSNLYQYTTEEWIGQAKKIHGDTYDYSQTVYKNAHTKIKIICHKHGLFAQRPYSHLAGHLCPECGIENRVRKRSSNTNEFVEKANNIHNGKYNYSKVKYKNTDTKVTIICPEHGNFKQTPHDHLGEHGCPVCGTSKAELFMIEYFKKNNIEYEWQYKKLMNPKTHQYLPYDFYLPDINTIVEYDGQFHFQQIHADRDLHAAQVRDRYKDMWARKYGYKIKRIKYTDDLEKELEKIKGIR